MYNLMSNKTFDWLIEVNKNNNAHQNKYYIYKIWHPIYFTQLKRGNTNLNLKITWF